MKFSNSGWLFEGSRLGLAPSRGRRPGSGAQRRLARHPERMAGGRQAGVARPGYAPAGRRCAVLVCCDLESTVELTGQRAGHGMPGGGTAPRPHVTGRTGARPRGREGSYRREEQGAGAPGQHALADAVALTAATRRTSGAAITGAGHRGSTHRCGYLIGGLPSHRSRPMPTGRWILKSVNLLAHLRLLGHGPQRKTTSHTGCKLLTIRDQPPYVKRPSLRLGNNHFETVDV